LNRYLEFPYVGQVFCIKRTSQSLKTKMKREEIVYGITSLTPEKIDLPSLLSLNRGHWSIENRLHYVRDETFGEDRSQIRTRNAPRVMAIFRNVAISLLRWLKKTNIAKALREIASKSYLALRLLRL